MLRLPDNYERGQDFPPIIMGGVGGQMIAVLPWIRVTDELERQKTGIKNAVDNLNVHTQTIASKADWTASALEAEKQQAFDCANALVKRITTFQSLLQQLAEAGFDIAGAWDACGDIMTSALVKVEALRHCSGPNPGAQSDVLEQPLRAWMTTASPQSEASGAEGRQSPVSDADYAAFCRHRSEIWGIVTPPTPLRDGGVAPPSPWGSNSPTE
ncbi:MAG: hypothetical protein KTR20_05545 [Cellvibrionaceae bacterium]|nr:hypothetical protein [Cellvibrionaceae bacterium]